MKRIVPLVTVAAMAAASLASPNPASAQSRAVARPATRATGHAVARPSYGYPAYRPNYRYGYPYRGYGYGYPYYGYPYYGTSFAFGIGIGIGVGFGWGWGYPYYGYRAYGYPFYYGAWGYPYGGPYPYPAGYYDYSGAARLEVRPREAEVYIDGYLVGTVDNFDGWAQRLNVAPGEHQLVIYLKGHRTFRENVLFRPGATLRVEHVMQPLEPGDVEEPRPVPESNGRPRLGAPRPAGLPAAAGLSAAARRPRARAAPRGAPTSQGSRLSTVRWPCACNRWMPRSLSMASRGSRRTLAASRCSFPKGCTGSRCGKRDIAPTQPRCGFGGGTRRRSMSV